MDSIIGCPNTVFYNEWLEDYQDDIFENPDCFERGPDGEFIYEDHFDSLYRDEEEGTSSVTRSEGCLLSSIEPKELAQPDKLIKGTEVCFCEICGTVGHATVGCPILTDPQFDWWNGATTEPVLPAKDSLELLEETPLESSVKDKSGVPPEDLVVDKEKSLNQNSVFPIEEPLAPLCDIDIFYIFILFVVLMGDYFAGTDEDQGAEEERHISQLDLVEEAIVEREEDIEQEMHLTSEPKSREFTLQANEDDVLFILPSFLVEPSLPCYYGGVDETLEEENVRRNFDDKNQPCLQAITSDDLEGNMEATIKRDRSKALRGRGEEAIMHDNDLIQHQESTVDVDENTTNFALPSSLTKPCFANSIQIREVISVINDCVESTPSLFLIKLSFTGLNEKGGEQFKKTSDLQPSSFDDPAHLLFGNEENKEEYSSKETSSNFDNLHIMWEESPENTEEAMHCSPRPKRAVRHGQRKFPFDRG